jgi:glycolate oxidase iron-sulfur subunit
MGQEAFDSSGAGALLRAQYDNMQSCIRCGLCLSACPTYQISFAEEEGPRGRIALARGFVEGHLDLSDDLVRHQETCLLCEACTAICPAGVQMEPIGTALRAVIGERPRPRWSRAVRFAVFERIFADMGRFRSVCGVARVYQRSGMRWLARRLGLLRLLHLRELEALLPEMDSQFFTPNGQVWKERGPSRGRAALFAGCIMSTAFAETDRATVRVLVQNGIETTACPGQGCCGALHLHSGEIEGARSLARRNIDAFATMGEAPIVVNAAGCGSTMKGYGHLLSGDPNYAEPAQAFAGRVRDASEFLEALPLIPPTRPIEQVVTLQEPCHLAHAQKIRVAPRTLLGAIPALRLVEMGESALCCGSAGIYNVTQPAKSAELLERKLDCVLATEAQTVATANPGCFLQLQAGLKARHSAVQVRHVIDLLDEAYRPFETMG